MPEHPYLPCGYNADSNNDDEVDGAGTNWPLEQLATDMTIYLTPLILTEEMLAVFDGTPDLILPCEDMTLTYPHEDVAAVVRADFLDWFATPANNTIVFQPDRRNQKIKEASQ